MTKYFQIYEDQENNVATSGLARAADRKPTKSVLNEISRNTKNPLKRIAKSDSSQAFSGKDDLAHLHTASNKRKRLDTFVSQNKENSFPAHPSIKTSSPVDSVAPLLVIPDSQDEDLSIVSFSDGDDSSVFLQDNSLNQVSLPPTEKETSSDDLFSVPEYSSEIYLYLKERERQVMPSWKYMERQRHVTHKMRAILVDWLVEVALEYKLSTQTVYLAVSYVDRFLSLMMVERSKLQLLGTAALFMAAKYEDIYPPELEEFVSITDNAYTKRQVLRMEHLILKVLNFTVSVPTSLSFLDHYSGMFMLDNTTLHLALYLTELSLLDGESFLKFPPSLVASSSLVLARHTLGGEEAWPADMAEKAGYSLEELNECVVELYESFVAAPSLSQQATRGKFMESRFDKVADISPVDIV